MYKHLIGRTALLLATLMLSAGTAIAYEAGSSEATRESQFTFAWPLSEGMLKPRGASTRGAPVTLDSEPSAAWKRLQEPDIDIRERDRRAILAMAGEYRVSFDFIEVARFDPDAKAQAPYQSWGTEVVLVSADEPDFIALQHVLVMRMLGEDGEVSEPMVMRHWRQEWRYQPETLLAYRGNHHWQETPVDAVLRNGAWSQTVLQVDDSPRYASVGRWRHDASQSTWISGDTLRPLPRREFSVRKDYDTLLGTNRHTVLSTGWLQEENNLKARLDDNGVPHSDQPWVGREYGVARYERIKGFDFDPGRAYFEASEPFWSAVRAAWAKALEDGDGSISMNGAADQQRYFMPFFAQAQKLADGEAAFDADEARKLAESTVNGTYIRH
ncbi:MAG: DUF6607 family protein [Lysobacteraceae bacterium]